MLVENLSVPLDRRVWQEALALRDAGASVTVVSPEGAGSESEPFSRIEGIDIHRFALDPAREGPFGYVREYSGAFWRMRQLVHRAAAGRSFDVVHACNPPDLLFLTAIAHRRRARFIYDQHDLVPELLLSRFGEDRKRLYRAALLAERATYGLAHVVLATNESYRQIAISRGHKPPADVFVVRNAPALDRLSPTTPDLSLKRGKPYLLAYLGIMGPQDGIDHALRALALLANRRSDWHAVLAGDGDVMPAMRTLALELGIADRTEFPGLVGDREIERILSTADVCLAPDPRSPLNEVSTMNKILEYMALGKPIVSYDLREARVSAAGAAVYARPNSEQDFADCIDGLLENEAERRRMGAEGQERIAGELSWDRSREALLAAYQHALDRPLPRSRSNTAGQT
jgi:glycosyltransferase involved in cell wall biosynthesis